MRHRNNTVTTPTLWITSPSNTFSSSHCTSPLQARRSSELPGPGEYTAPSSLSSRGSPVFDVRPVQAGGSPVQMGGSVPAPGEYTIPDGFGCESPHRGPAASFAANFAANHGASLGTKVRFLAGTGAGAGAGAGEQKAGDGGGGGGAVPAVSLDLTKLAARRAGLRQTPGPANYHTGDGHPDAIGGSGSRGARFSNPLAQVWARGTHGRMLGPLSGNLEWEVGSRNTGNGADEGKEWGGENWGDGGGDGGEGNWGDTPHGGEGLNMSDSSPWIHGTGRGGTAEGGPREMLRGATGEARDGVGAAAAGGVGVAKKTGAGSIWKKRARGPPKRVVELLDFHRRQNAGLLEAIRQEQAMEGQREKVLSFATKASERRTYEEKYASARADAEDYILDLARKNQKDFDRELRFKRVTLDEFQKWQQSHGAG